MIRKSCLLSTSLRPPVSHNHGLINLPKRLCILHQPCRAFSSATFNSTDSIMKTTCVLYKPIEDVERIEHYRAGGYHPVKIGERFHNRYRMVHKLGHGTYSTVWLAQDEVSNRYVAVKVCTAGSSPRESNVLSRLSEPQRSPDTRRSMIPLLLDMFNTHGPNGDHNCLATTPARMSISEAKSGSWISLFQLEVARAIAAQLVIAVEYIHSQGFVHGDLHCGNILFQLSFEFDHLSTETLYEKYGQPILEPVNRLDGKKLPPEVPQHGVIPVWLGKASEDLTLQEARILLSDFGEAFSPTEEQRYKSHTPLVVRPPEARFEPTKPLTFSSDIWTLGCTIWDIIAQRTLFEGFITNEEDMSCQQIELLGPLPIEWWEKWESYRKCLPENAMPIERPKPFSQSWEDRFETNIQRPRIEEGMPSFEPSERRAFLSMLRWMLSFRPEDRPSAQQVLESEWMVNRALPEYEKIRNKQL